MKVRKVKFTVKSNNEEKIFEINKSIKNNSKIKARTIFLNDDLGTIKIVYNNNKGETFNYNNIDNMEYEHMSL